MLAAAEAAGVVHLLGTEFRWDPGQATLARAVADGAVGEPRLATVILHVPMLADESAEVPAWWADAGSGGGWRSAHGSPVIDQLRVTLGEFAGVAWIEGVGSKVLVADAAGMAVLDAIRRAAAEGTWVEVERVASETS